MTYEEIIEEVKARGFSYENEARIKRWINQVYREICDYKPWPFLVATKEGAGPLEISDFGHAIAVVDVASNSPLRFADINELVLYDPTLETTGTPARWYWDGAEKKVKPYPVSTTTLKVTYVKVPADLSKSSDEPIIPAAYHGVIVDGVVAKAYKPTDNFEAMQYTRQEFDRGLRGMVHALLKPNYDSERRIIRTGGPEDYL